MIEIKGSVKYADGSAQQFTGGPWAISQWERYALRNNLEADATKCPMTWSLFVAYAAMHRDSWGKCEGFEAWSLKVDDVDLETAETNPTNPTVSGG